MIKRYVLIFLSVMLLCKVNAQEFRCAVSINNQKLLSTTQSYQSTDKKVFESMKQALEDFINSRRWTNLDLEQHEKIDCSFSIILNERTSLTDFKGQITMQMRRPVYNSSYTTGLFNYIESADFAFVYNESQPLDYDPNTFLRPQRRRAILRNGAHRLPDRRRRAAVQRLEQPRKPESTLLVYGKPHQLRLQRAPHRLLPLPPHGTRHDDQRPATGTTEHHRRPASPAASQQSAPQPAVRNTIRRCENLRDSQHLHPGARRRTENRLQHHQGDKPHQHLQTERLRHQIATQTIKQSDNQAII